MKKQDRTAGKPPRGAELYAQQLRGLAKAALAINSALSLNEMLQVITDQSRDVIGAHQSVTSLTLNQSWSQAINAVSLSEKYATWANFRAPPDGSGITSIVCEMNRPFRMTQEELVSHPAWRNFGRYAKEHPPMRGWLAAPLTGRDGRNLGALQLSDRYEGEFTESDEAILVQLAQMASVAIENVRLFEKANEAQRKLRAQLELTSAITDSLGEGVAALDAAGRVTFLNPAGERILGRRASELLGKSLQAECRCEPPIDLGGAAGPAASAASRNGTESGPAAAAATGEYDATFARPDGTLFPLNCTRSPIVADGKVVGAVLAFRDVTDRRRLEDQLRQAHRMEAVGRFAGGVAHDFNNLVSVILGFGEMAMARCDAAGPVRGYLEEIRRAGESAESLTRQLLAFSRRQVLQFKVVDLGAMVAGMEKMLRRLVGESIEVVVRRAPGLGKVRADPGQIEQVIMNLVVNARDAMPDGGAITIETAEAVLDEEMAGGHGGAKPGPYVTLAVSDTGCGMDAATQAQIFEPFFTTKEKGVGTGLGLATVYGIIKQSNGTIWVYSEPGRGTTFRIYFPRVEPDAEPVPPRDEAPANHLGTETVLVVEDNQQVLALACDILRTSGYSVLSAANGERALEIGRGYDGPIHLLLTDVVMPGINGRDLAERMTSLRPGLKTIFMSGYTDLAVVRNGELAPGSAFVQKPFRRDVLAANVRKVLDTAGHSPPPISGLPSNGEPRKPLRRAKRPKPQA